MRRRLSGTLRVSRAGDELCWLPTARDFQRTDLNGRARVIGESGPGDLGPRRS